MQDVSSLIENKGWLSLGRTVIEFRLQVSMETSKYSITFLPSEKTKISLWKENACQDMKFFFYIQHTFKKEYNTYYCPIYHRS